MVKIGAQVDFMTSQNDLQRPLRNQLSGYSGALEDFQHWKSLLDQWNNRINLVSQNAMADFWTRHALDSWQLWPHIPESAQTLLDLGSGAGFPGIAMAIGCKSRGMGHVTLVESAGKKANFLRTVIRELDLPAKVWADRAEKLSQHHTFQGPYDVITARAFAPLPRLFTYAQAFWGEGTEALLLKGETVTDELTQASESWIYHVTQLASVSDPSGSILKIKGLQSRL